MNKAPQVLLCQAALHWLPTWAREHLQDHRLSCCTARSHLFVYLYETRVSITWCCGRHLCWPEPCQIQALAGTKLTSGTELTAVTGRLSLQLPAQICAWPIVSLSLQSFRSALQDNHDHCTRYQKDISLWNTPQRRQIQSPSFRGWDTIHTWRGSDQSQLVLLAPQKASACPQCLLLLLLQMLGWRDVLAFPGALAMQT